MLLEWTERKWGKKNSEGRKSDSGGRCKGGGLRARINNRGERIKNDKDGSRIKQTRGGIQKDDREGKGVDRQTERQTKRMRMSE